MSSRALNRHHLLGYQKLEECSSRPPIRNDIVVALEHFRSRESLPPILVRKWIGNLCPTSEHGLSEKQLRTKVNKVVQNYNKLRKSKKPQMLRDFLEHPFFYIIPGSGSMISDTAIVNDNELTICPECINLKKVLSDNEFAIKDLKIEKRKTFEYE